MSLYTINVPSKFNRKSPTPSYLVKWDCSKWLPKLSQPAGIEPLTQMALRYIVHYHCIMKQDMTGYENKEIFNYCTQWFSTVVNADKNLVKFGKN